MTKTLRIKVSGALLAALAMGGCDLLDVSNPNNLVEESIRNTAAAAAVVNGAQALVYDAVSRMWQPYMVAGDELYWIGSRDAWLSLDQGQLSNPENEFTDESFPSLGAARWMSDEALTIIKDHIDDGETLGGDAQLLLARASLYAGIIYTVIGEIQEDFALSNKTDAGAPIGPANMYQMLDNAVGYLNTAVTAAQAAGNDQLRMHALMMRARAHHARGMWGKIKPSIAANPLVSSTAARDDALAAIGLAGGITADVSFQAAYSAATVGNYMANWINSRKENNIDPLYATSASNADITGIALKDPIDNVADPAVADRVAEFRINGNDYVPLNLANTRMMHLIVAEHELASNNAAGFATHINHVRAMDNLTAYSGQISDMDMLKHARRANLMLMGQRLTDMYRFQITDARWLPGSDAAGSPGTLLPITIVEIRANCHLNGQGC